MTPQTSWPWRRIAWLLLAIVLVTLAILAVVPALLYAQPAASCSHWAAPTGSGTACSQAQPCKVAAFWPLAAPGHTLCLQGGTYRGTDSMILPPPRVFGTRTKPLTVKAEHDGQVLLDAQHQGFAVHLAWHGGGAQQNAWMVVEGVNATNGLEAVFQVSSSDSQLRRTVGWNGTSGANSFAYNVIGYRSRAIDCAGWGANIRKVMNGSQAGNLQGAGFTRCWAEWNDHPEGESGPNDTYELGYTTQNQRFENILGTWNQRGQVGEPEHVLHIFPGQNMASNDMAGTTVLGALLYARPGATVGLSALVGAYDVSNVVYEDLAAIVPPAFPQMASLYFAPCAVGRCRDNVCRNCLAVATTPPVNGDNSGWTTPGLRSGRTLADATGGQSAFTLLPGLCRRYEQGVLTDTALWPWPMRDRIKAAREASGYGPTDVQAEVEAALGPIPPQCKGEVTPPEPEPEPPPTPAGTPLACTGIQGAQGALAIACVPQPGRR